MKWFYRLGVFFARLILRLVSIINPRVRHFLKSRDGLFDRLIQYRSSTEEPIAWFHVASLGEYEQARPVIEKIRGSNPHLQIVLSFFSPSGYDNATKKKQPYVDFITYIPLDSKTQAFLFVKILNPSVVVFTKYDLWYHHILAVKLSRIPLFLIAASFRPNQLYFRYDGFFRSILFQFDYIFTQNEESLYLLKSIGYTSASQSGDTRFDRVFATATEPKKFDSVEAWVGSYEVLVAGSVWEEDMQLLIPLINSHPEYRWIIAPHDLRPGPMNSWMGKITLPSSTYSSWNGTDNPSVIFIDNIGMLSSLYQFGRIAYIGGGFGKGLHNILEPLGFGIPVIFGKLKNSSKFPEAKQSVREGCGFEVGNAIELNEAFNRLQLYPFYTQSANSAKKWVRENLGAAQRICEKINQLKAKT